MRIWSLHPKYLDTKGFVALWREGLLALAVLEGRTKGYRHHPQLVRFLAEQNSAALMKSYLRAVFDESVHRGFSFDLERIFLPQGFESQERQLRVTRGQLHFEWQHLLGKLQQRDPSRFDRLKHLKRIEPHPLFFAVAGGCESWEKGVLTT